VAQCYNQPNLPAVFCSRLQRDATTGQLLGVQNQLFNAATESVEGLDAQLGARVTPRFIPGRFDLRATYARLFKHDFLARPGGTVDRRAGQVGDSKDRLLLGATYTLGEAAFSWDARYLSGALADSLRPADALGNQVSAVWTHDVQLRFSLADDRYGFTLGVTNLFDRQPPLVTDPSRNVTDTNVYGGVYDLRGRFFYTTASVRF
jgi:outer membrane receptor protein involved in Fe transport